MSKKRVKSATGSAAVQRWEQALVSTPFVEEGHWTSCIGFVVGNQIEDYKNIEILAAAVNAGTRRLFSIITKDDLYAQVNELGSPKGKKPKEIPQNYEVCEPCKDYLDSGEEIPVALLAKLIKFRLLDIKQRDQKRRETEKKGDKGKDKGGKKGEKKERAKSPGKGKAGKKTPEPPSAKEGSKLRKRGEEDLDGKYIDDEPDDGVSHYIFISGFHEPHLIGQLAEINIEVNTIIRMTSEDYSRFKKDDSDDLDPAPEKDEKQLAAEEEARTLSEKKTKSLVKFWKDVPLLLQTSKLQDVARQQHIIKDASVPPSLDNNEVKMKFGADIFEAMACLLYDLLDAKRQWKNFLANLKLIAIPAFTQNSQLTSNQESQHSAPSMTMAPSKPEKNAAAQEVPTQTEGEPGSSPAVDMRYYNDLMDHVPLESSSVPLIMHCMLEQICASEEDREPPSETPRPARADGMDEVLANHMSSLTYKLALSEEEQQILASEFDQPKQVTPAPKQPILLSYRDDIGHRLNHLKPCDDFNPLKAELEMMGYFAVSDLIRMPSCLPHDMKDRSARLQELLHFCATGATTAAEVDHAFKQFVFESMNLTQTDGEGKLISKPAEEQRDIPFDDPYPFYVGLIPQDECAEIDKDPDSQCIDRSESGLGSVLSAGSLYKRQSQNRTGARSPSPGLEVRNSPVQEMTPSSPGILRHLSSATSRRSAAGHSVHFESENERNCLSEVDEPSSEIPSLSLEEHSMDNVNDTQKRNLDQWCFAEHLESSIFLQVLQQSQYTHPFIDTYYHKRDNTILVVLHNPYSENLQRHEEWSCQLHSNVGFRNYLEHIAGNISDWVRDEEAKYHAMLLAKEVERLNKEADEASSRPNSAKDKNRERSKSPKKSPSRTGKSPSRGSSAERTPRSNPFIREGSLKAWKEEHDRVKAEEEEKEREKQEKRVRSATKKASKDVVDEKDKKRPTSRSSSKSKVSKEEPVVHAEKPEQPLSDEPFWMFTGYDLGNQMLHAKGSVTTMFPADGGQIRTEKYQFEHGTLGVKSVVMKDGHSFTIHVLEPKGHEEETCTTPSPSPDGSTKEEPEKAELEKSEKEAAEKATPRSGMNSPVPDVRVFSPDDKPENKPCVGAFGSLTAQLVDGMSLSLSVYGNSGEPLNGQKYEPAPYVAPPARSLSPSGKEAAASPTKTNKKDKTNKPAAAATPEPPVEEEIKVNAIEEVKVTQQPFQRLHITCPDGLHVNYFLASSVGIIPEDPSVASLLVRQNYPFPTSGTQPSELSRKAVMNEVSRVTNIDGTVIKVLKDGSMQVLFANGTVSQFVMGSPLISPSEADITPRPGSSHSNRDTSPTKKGRNKSAGKKKEITPLEEPVEEVTPDPGYWITTLPSGERIATTKDGSKVPVKDALVCKATDPQTRQVMYTREDHTVLVYHPDGTTVAEHADGTRITTFITETNIPKTSDQSETCEQKPCTETKQIKLIQVECPGYATLRFDTDSGECSTEFGIGTIINTFLDGSYDIYHSDGGYLRVESDGSSIYHSKPNNDLEVMDPNHRLQYVMCHFADTIVEIVDNQGNLFNVTNFGECRVMTANNDEIIEEITEQKSENVNEDEKPSMEQEMSDKKTIRTYQQHAPKLFIVHPDGSGTELLRYQDVSEFLTAAEDDASTAILMDPLSDYPDVLGVTVMKPYTKDVSSRWLRDYSQKSIIPPGLKSRDLTTIPAREQKKDGPAFGTNLGHGLAIGSLVKTEQQPPVLKCPSALEIRQLLQYKPVSQQLRNKLGTSLQEYADYMKSRTADSIALQILDPRSEEEKMQAADLLSHIQGTGSGADLLADDVKGLYERATAAPIPSPPPTPQPKRSQADWDRDEREKLEEARCREALRKHDVPPYWETPMGKSFLLTQAPDMEALTKQLAEDPRRDGSRAIRSNTPQSYQSSLSNHTSPNNANSHPGSVPPPAGNTPSALRPGNPTPAHATGQASPTTLRPHNPTPAQATKVVPDRPGAPTGDSTSPNDKSYRSIPESESEEPVLQYEDSTNVNVQGEPRTEPIRLPGYIKSGRPGAIPNQKFLEVEDPVRRKTYTTSITGATPKGAYIISQMRGFELLPDYVDFGTLREGSTYQIGVYLKNTGIDACRFRVKQPPPSTGMKVMYQPGPVAAGMKTKLTVEIYAIAAGVEGNRGVGKISHDLEIVSETDHLMLPVSATVLTANEYDNRNVTAGSTGPGVKWVSDKAPGGQAIIRARTLDKNGREVKVH